MKLLLCLLLGFLSLLILPVGAEVLSLQTAQPVAQAPVVDGKLDDACWQTLPKVGTFYAFFSGVPRPAASKTEYQFGYTADGVYLAIRFFDPHIATIKAAITTPGDPSLWTDDSAEIYLDPAGTAIGFRKFMANSLGTRAGAFQLDAANIDMTWNPDAWKVATSKDAEGWKAEFFFPASVLGRAPRAGALWRFAITRFAYAAKSLHATSAPGAKFFNPENFGWLYFSETENPDPIKLGHELKDQMPGDWVLPLGGQAVAKQGGEIRVVRLDAPVASGKKAATEALEAARALPTTPEISTTLQPIAEKIAAIPDGITDPADFSKAILDLADVRQSIENYTYSRKLEVLLALHAPPPAQVKAKGKPKAPAKAKTSPSEEL